MDRRMREAVRYLGYGTHAVDDRTAALISSSFAELESTACKRSVYRIFELQTTGADCLNIGTMEIQSCSLYKNLRNCSHAVLFAATLGADVDRWIKRRTVTDMSAAVVCQACAAVLLEEYCDACQAEIADVLREEKKYLRPRFSPGYGDFDIRHQKDMLGMLDAAKAIGLSMTGSFMLTPVKSVTAVIGAGSDAVPCHREGCEACKKSDCIYRRS